MAQSGLEGFRSLPFPTSINSQKCHLPFPMKRNVSGYVSDQGEILPKWRTVNNLQISLVRYPTRKLKYSAKGARDYSYYKSEIKLSRKMGEEHVCVFWEVR